MSPTAAVPVGRQIAWSPPLIWLPRALLEPCGVWRAVITGWLLAFPASIFFAALVHWIAPTANAPEFHMTSITAVFLLVVFSPALESLIMGAVLLILLRLVPPTRAVIISALGWCMAHSLAAPIWGLITWWPFLIFSTLFVAWRPRSLWLAFTLPMIVHGLQNLPPALLVASARG